MYSKEITRKHRAAVIIALDRSGSMQEQIRFGHTMMTKAAMLAQTASALISELIDRCRRTDALRNYYDIAVVGYGNNEVEMLLGGDGFISIEEAERHRPKSIVKAFEEQLPNGEWAMIEHSITEWIEPKAEGNTPMYEALLLVRNLAAEWCAKSENHDSFPPVVIHITDGEASDCDDGELIDICSQIKQLGTSDGNLLLLNIHISANETLPAMAFPTLDDITTAGHYAHTLAECSSTMPEVFNEAIYKLKGRGVKPPFIGMGYNASVIELLSIINIGSRSVNNMQ